MLNKAAKISITKDLFLSLLGLQHRDIEILYTQVKHDHFQEEKVELIITGEGLPSEFEVKQGELVKESYVEITKEYLRGEVKVSK